MRYLLVVLFLLADCAPPGPPFDQQRWRDADLSTRVRADMAPSLVKSHRLDGQDRAAVIALLGDANQADNRQGSEMVYLLGPDATYTPIDNEWLVIKLDRQGRVASYKVQSD